MKVPYLLRVFPPPPTLSENGLKSCLAAARVWSIVHHVLGPEGTNMQQACQSWNRDCHVESKAQIKLCVTPERAMEQARCIVERGVLPTFWTCAVYYKLNTLFFENPDTFPFLFCYSFPLDKMQLCARPNLAAAKCFHAEWRIASHPSPAPLVQNLPNLVVEARSNGEAAKMCAESKAELCITTARAAALNSLVMLHEFGSPIMVFFVGTTEHGLNVLFGR